MRKRTALWLLALTPLLMANDGCTDESTSIEHDAVERQDALYARDQPPPAFDWSLERHIMSQVYQARNSAVSTWSYVVSEYTGKLLWSCPSLGFPIPYSAQLTSPTKVAYVHGAWRDLPQAEPNGLYPPPSAAATIVPCLGPGGKIVPVYEEHDVSSFFQPMQPGPDGIGLVPVPGARPTISIDARGGGRPAAQGPRP